MKRLLALLLLLASPALGQVTFSNVDLTNVDVSAAAAGGCNEFTDDFTGANLDDWTAHASFSLNTTNDVLEQDSGLSAGISASYNATSTTDGDDFAKITFTDINAGSWYGGGVILRCTSGLTSASCYAVNEYEGTMYGEKWDFGGTVGLGTWDCNLTGGGYSHDIVDGDVIAASVSGTGSGTSLKLWVNPDAGDCPADWGTHDKEWTYNASCVVDTEQTYVGVMINDHIATGANQVMDDFVGGDN